MKFDVAAIINAVAALITASTGVFLAYKGNKQKKSKKENEK